MTTDQKRHVLYPNHYAWLLFAAAMDIFMTYIVLSVGGYEANPLASGIIERFGVPGMVVFKLVTITVAIVIAEEIGRRNATTGRKFLVYAIAISCIPVVLAFTLLFRHVR